mgnify:FL=1
MKVIGKHTKPISGYMIMHMKDKKAIKKLIKEYEKIGDFYEKKNGYYCPRAELFFTASNNLKQQLLSL